SSRRRHTRFSRDWSSDVCSSDLGANFLIEKAPRATTNGQRQPERSAVSLDWGFEGTPEEEIEETPHEEEEVRAEETEPRRSRRQIGRASWRGRVRGGGVA